MDTKLLIRSPCGPEPDPSIQDLENMAYTDVMNMMYRMDRRTLPGGFAEESCNKRSQRWQRASRADSDSTIEDYCTETKKDIRTKKGGKEPPDVPHKLRGVSQGNYREKRASATGCSLRKGDIDRADQRFVVAAAQLWSFDIDIPHIESDRVQQRH